MNLPGICGFALAANDDVFVADHTTNVVLKATHNGVRVEFAGTAREALTLTATTLRPMELRWTAKAISMSRTLTIMFSGGLRPPGASQHWQARQELPVRRTGEVGWRDSRGRRRRLR